MYETSKAYKLEYQKLIFFGKLQGVPKKMVIRKGFEFLTLGGVFLGVKNNSKNFGNKKILGCLAKF